MISGNMVGTYSQIGKTLILIDEDGYEIPGVIVDQETLFNVTVEDVKLGKTFAGSEGVQIGVDTRTYRATHGNKFIFPGESFSIVLEQYDQYDYTQFQAMIAVYNTSITDSVSTDKIALYNAVYNTSSNSKLADITKNATLKSIDLNIVNDTDNTYVIHYNTYKEE